jgi:hypothetical protein
VALVIVVKNVKDMLAELVGLAMREENFIHVDEFFLI